MILLEATVLISQRYYNSTRLLAQSNSTTANFNTVDAMDLIVGVVIMSSLAGSMFCFYTFRLLCKRSDEIVNAGIANILVTIFVNLRGHSLDKYK